MLPRILRPEKGNKYYINTADGGVNPAKGNPKRLNKDLTSLPNCCMIYGWFNEVGQKGMQYLKKAYYPYAVIAQAKREGLEVTQEPTLGGIMVWTGGRTGEGHVAGVAQVFDEKHILTTESEYYGADWKNFKRYKGNGNWADGCPWMTSLYTYQGCIKNPFIEDEMTYEKFCEYMTKWLEENGEMQFSLFMRAWLAILAKKPADPWAEDAIKRVTDAGLMVGDPDGNFRPQSYVKREELAQILSNILLSK